MDFTVTTKTQKTLLLCLVVFLGGLAGCAGLSPSNTPNTTSEPQGTTYEPRDNFSNTSVEITDWGGEYTVDLFSVGNADHIFVETQHESVNVTSNVTGGIFYPEPILESQRGERGIVTEDHFLLSGDTGGVNSRVTVDLTNATVTNETIEVYAVIDEEERLIREYEANYTRGPTTNQTERIGVKAFN